jgi:5'-nucleotidase
LTQRQTMRILICNDDGIDAPGIRLLAEAARMPGAEVWVVAPERKWTAASHQLSFDRDLTLTRTAEREYACSGGPADCVVAAMTVLFRNGIQPDLVLAGINDGNNVAEDLAYSGTIAIGREAAFWKVPAICLSRPKGLPIGPIESAALSRLLQTLWNARASWIGEGRWLNINLPASLPAAMAQARIGRDKIASASDVLEATGECIRYRIQRGRRPIHSPGDESAVIASGRISVVRHRWNAQDALANALVAEWNAAIE